MIFHSAGEEIGAIYGEWQSVDYLMSAIPDLFNCPVVTD
jgi:hypothetical protein